VELRQSVLQLQGEVAQLRQELAQVRAELANVTANTGVGGSGQAGVAPAGAGVEQGSTAGGASAQGAVGGSGTAGRETTLRAGTSAETGQRGAQARDTDNAGEAVVNAIYTGKVRSVSNKALVLVDDSGQPFTVEVGAQTRFISKGRRISAQELKQGTRVRAIVDLLSGREQATEVTTLP
jgi:hypothetical protein